MKPNPKLLLTRPQAQSEHFAKQLAHDGIETLIHPMLAIIPREIKALPEHANATLITSANALHAAPKDIPLVCVGDATTTQARNRGLNATCAGENVNALVDYVAAHYQPDAELIYLSSSHITHDLSDALPKHTITRIVCYDAIATDTPPILDDIVAVSFFSRRTAEIFCSLISAENTCQLVAFCLSEAIAEVLDKSAFKAIHITQQATADSMRALLLEHCDIFTCNLRVG